MSGPPWERDLERRPQPQSAQRRREALVSPLASLLASYANGLAFHLRPGRRHQGLGSCRGGGSIDNYFEQGMHRSPTTFGSIPPGEVGSQNIPFSHCLRSAGRLLLAAIIAANLCHVERGVFHDCMDGPAGGRSSLRRGPLADGRKFEGVTVGAWMTLTKTCWWGARILSGSPTWITVPPCDMVRPAGYVLSEVISSGRTLAAVCTPSGQSYMRRPRWLFMPAAD